MSQGHREIRPATLLSRLPRPGARSLGPLPCAARVPGARHSGSGTGKHRCARKASSEQDHGLSRPVPRGSGWESPVSTGALTRARSRLWRFPLSAPPRFPETGQRGMVSEHGDPSESSSTKPGDHRYSQRGLEGPGSPSRRADPAKEAERHGYRGPGPAGSPCLPPGAPRPEPPGSRRQSRW